MFLLNLYQINQFNPCEGTDPCMCIEYLYIENRCERKVAGVIGMLGRMGYSMGMECRVGNADVTYVMLLGIEQRNVELYQP